jgi:hypothetical protein
LQGSGFALSRSSSIMSMISWITETPKS